jgi:hypothetical protein
MQNLRGSLNAFKNIERTEALNITSESPEEGRKGKHLIASYPL